MRSMVLAGALLLAPPTVNAKPSLAPWGARSGETLAIDSARGPWARRWVGRSDVGAVMLTVYRSAGDAQKVAMFARGLNDGPEHDDDRAFLRGYLPHAWQTRVRAIRATVYKSEARGLCAIVWTGEKPLRLCTASRQCGSRDGDDFAGPRYGHGSGADAGALCSASSDPRGRVTADLLFFLQALLQ